MQIEPQHDPAERDVNIRLALIGLAAAGLYVLLARRYPMAAGLSQPRAGWADLTGANWASAALHIAIYFGLTLLYIQALRLLLRSPRSGPTRALIILPVWLACSAILLAVAPSGESHDVFDYLFRGRMMTELGANPLTDVPDQYSRAPYYPYVAWRSHVDTYGPLWEMASAATAATVRSVMKAAGTWQIPVAPCPASTASCRILTAYVTGYRLLAIGLTGISAWLIAGMMRRSRLELAAAALTAWLWSPLLLMSTAVGAHNDALLITLLLFVLWLLQRERWFPALWVLILALHIKLTAIVVIPVVALWLVRRCGWRRTLMLVAASAAVGLLLSWLLYAPFGGWRSLPRMLSERAAFLSNSPWQVLSELLKTWGWQTAAARQVSVRLSSALFAFGSVLLSLWMLDFRPRRWKAASPPDWTDDRLLWRAVAANAMLYLLVGSFWFQHWYVMLALAPAALLPDSLLTRRLLPWLGFGALTANVVAAFASPAIPKGRPKTILYALLVAIIWAPMLIAGGFRLERRPRGGQRGA
jgi:hypothetical protein